MILLLKTRAFGYFITRFEICCLSTAVLFEFLENTSDRKNLRKEIVNNLTVWLKYPDLKSSCYPTTHTVVKPTLWITNSIYYSGSVLPKTVIVIPLFMEEAKRHFFSLATDGD
jgi:hypothetical protein